MPCSTHGQEANDLSEVVSGAQQTEVGGATEGSPAPGARGDDALRLVSMRRLPLPAVLRRRLDALRAEHPDADPHEAAEDIRRLVDALDPPNSPPAHATARDLRSAADHLDDG